MQTFESLERVVAESAGPRLLILNTMDGAERSANYLQRVGQSVIHLSTALSPHDRERILRQVTARLADPNDQNWTLVATSLVEAGVDLSFRTGFRERFSVSSIVQTGGRVNRHGEYGQGTVFDFTLGSITGVSRHPAAHEARPILK